MDAKIIQQVKQRYSIVGNSDGLNHALDIAIQVAPTELSVLIMGESGVGKEVLPRVIHDNSSRKHNKYFAINCGSLPEGTIDSELFGHKKGSFTGALDDREGYFGVANNGTLFLDEVGELPLSTQARLLRVLETGEYIRVGESEVRKTNVRIVAATNVNMQKAIKEGKFREDLYYRLNTIPISMPPLRERGKDIELLFRKFAYDMAQKYRLDAVRLTEDGRDLLQKYKWPGNIRQLRNITEQISIISREREITADILKQYGVTDDTIGEAGLVLQSNRMHGQSASDAHSYENEREMLFGLLGQIGKEVKELKEFIHNNASAVPHSAVDNYTIINNEDVFSSGKQPMPYQASVIHQPNTTIMNNGSFAEHDIIQTVDAEMVDDTPMSINEIMKMNIIDSLKRNNGNRRKSAKELGISDRTLYRKIKEYGLDF